MSDLIHDINCLNCGREFEAKSLKAKYCSNSCKTRYNRKKNSDIVHGHIDSIMYHFRQLFDDMEQNPELFLEQGILAVEKMSEVFDKNLPVTRGSRCLRSGMENYLGDKPKFCHHCEDAKKNAKQKDVKERYSVPCRYVDTVLYDRNDFNIDLRDYDVFRKDSDTD